MYVKASGSTVQYHAARELLVLQVSHWHNYKDDVPHMQESLVQRNPH